MSVYAYLFEAKSVQNFIFRTGKLKDVIAASECLGNLIDDQPAQDNRPPSLLVSVLDALNITSDLIDVQANEAKATHFLRAKGGAFYCYSRDKSTLEHLRSLWTLTIQQQYPGLVWIDALVAGDTLEQAITHGHSALSACRNLPQPSFPIATSPLSRCGRTGNAQVPLTRDAHRAQLNDDIHRLDMDTNLTREYYQTQLSDKGDLRQGSPLQDRFTPPALRPNGEYSVRYPLDLATEKGDWDYTLEVNGQPSYSTLDLALVHIDGNGLGIVLRALKQGLTGEAIKALTPKQQEAVFCQGFRQFSSLLGDATEAAAQAATQWLTTQVEHTDHFKHSQAKQNAGYLPMRPLVLGGDDVTLFCHPRFALGYSQRLCRVFEAETKNRLKNLGGQLKEQHGVSIALPEKLTASGGILYQKHAHPFNLSHHFVEDLCSYAKGLTKDVVKDETDEFKKIGPAALAVYRRNQAATDDFEQAREHAQTYSGDLIGKATINKINLGANRFLVDHHIQTPCFGQLERLLALCSHARTPSETPLATDQKPVIQIAKLREMAGWLLQGNFSEAERIWNNHWKAHLNQANQWQQALQVLAPKDKVPNHEGKSLPQWFWVTDNTLETPLYDLITADHYAAHTQSEANA